MKESNHKFKEKPVGVDAHIDPHFKEIPKNNKGITLIALIITIIVMMILVAVTVTFTIGENGILKNTREAKFKQEVSQIIDFVNMEKAAIIAEKKANNKPEDSYTNDEVYQLTKNIPQNLKEKYLDTNKIYAETDGQLYYNPDLEIVPQQEAIWLGELKIDKGLTFKETVKKLVDTAKKIEGNIRLDILDSNIKAKYPDAFVYIMFNEEYIEAYGSSETEKINAVIKILEIAQEEGLSDSVEISQTSTDENMIKIAEIRDIFKKEDGTFPTWTNTIGGFKTNYNAYANLMGMLKLNVIRNGNNLLIAGNDGSITDYVPEDIAPMSINEAASLISFTHSDVDYEDYQGLYVRGYKGPDGEEEAIIPDIIYDYNGEILGVVTEIDDSSFKTFSEDDGEWIPYIDLVGIPLEYYKTSTVKQLYEDMTGEEYTGENPNETSVDIKNNILLSSLKLSGGLSENDIEYVTLEDGTKLIAVFNVDDEGIVPKGILSSKTVKKLKIGSRIKKVRSEAFSELPDLTEITFCGAISTSEYTCQLGSRAFQNAQSLTTINLKQNSSTDAIPGIDNFWGATNSNITINFGK